MKLRILYLTVGASIIGLLIGAIIGVFSSFVYLLIVMPAFAAAITGAATSKLMKTLRVEGLKVATAVGSIAAVLTLVALLSTSFQMQVAAVVTEYSSQKGYSNAGIEKRINDWKKDAGGTLQFTFLTTRIKNGARLSSGVFMDFGPVGNSVVLFLELLVCLTTTLWLTRRQGSRPFCEKCDRWFARRIIGSAPLGSQSAIAAALKGGHFHRLGRRLKNPKLSNPVLLHGRFCDTCSDGNVYLELELGEPGKRPHSLYQTTTTHAFLDAILESRSMAGD
jgi:hypothetical protein